MFLSYRMGHSTPLTPKPKLNSGAKKSECARDLSVLGNDLTNLTSQPTGR